MVLTVSTPSSAEFLGLASEIGALRSEVWQSSGMKTSVNTGFGPTLDEWDQSAEHWLVYEDYRLVVSARLSTHWDLSELEYFEDYPPVPYNGGKIGYYGRLVVRRDMKDRRGVAAKIDQLRYEKAKERGCELVLAAVTPWRVANMLAAGYRNLGPIVFRDPSQHEDVHYVPNLMMRTC